MHIDLGYVEEVHLMLDREHAEDFINFIKKKRSQKVDRKEQTFSY